MDNDIQKKRILNLFIHVLYLVFFTSIIFSLRAVTSISLAAMLLTGFLVKSPAWSSLFQKKSRTLFLAGCIILFLLQLLALFYTNDRQEGWNNVRVKTGLLVTPLAAFVFCRLTTTPGKKLLFHYCLLLVAAALYCLCISFLDFKETNDTSLFFYHALVSPIKQHAVYFSVLVIIGLAFLLEAILKREFIFTRLFHISLVIFLSAFLFLLSSKLVIAFYILCLVYYFINLLQKNKLKRVTIGSLFILCIAIVGLLFITRNPIRYRFSDMLQGNVKIITQEHFAEGDYFNGLQFRLLQWRFVPEILTENNRWLLGVSPGDAQTLLNKKYLSKNMYAGDPAKGDHGYLIYNTHNQFLETLLQNGITGLIVLLVICFSLIQMMIKERNRVASVSILLLLAWLFTESVFETQYGIVIFTFFPLFLCNDKIKPGESGKANLLKTYSDI